MNCFICKDARWVLSAIPSRNGSLTLTKKDCDFCGREYYVFLTQPQLRQSGKAFKDIISKKGVQFIASDKMRSTTQAVELGSELPISNLYLRNVSLPDEMIKSVRGRGEIIKVTGSYLYGLIIKKMIEYQKLEIKKSGLSNEIKDLACKNLRESQTNTVLGYTAITITC